MFLCHFCVIIVNPQNLVWFLTSMAAATATYFPTNICMASGLGLSALRHCKMHFAAVSLDRIMTVGIKGFFSLSLPGSAKTFVWRVPSVLNSIFVISCQETEWLFKDTKLPLPEIWWRTLSEATFETMKSLYQFWQKWHIIGYSFKSHGVVFPVCEMQTWTIVLKLRLRTVQKWALTVLALFSKLFCLDRNFGLNNIF